MKKSQRILGVRYQKELTQLMSETNVLTSIIDGVLEDVKSRIVPISQLQEQLQ